VDSNAGSDDDDDLPTDMNHVDDKKYAIVVIKPNGRAVKPISPVLKPVSPVLKPVRSTPSLSSSPTVGRCRLSVL